MPKAMALSDPGQRAAIKNVLHTGSYHSADCDRDHSLVCCKIRMQPKKFHLTKTNGDPRIDVSKLSQSGSHGAVCSDLREGIWRLLPGDSVTEKRQALRDTMYRTALAIFGKNLQNHMTGSKPNQP